MVVMIQMIKPYYKTPYRQGSRGWINEQYFSLNNFSGGLNNVEPDNEINDNESTDCMNMRFIDDTIMEKRPGIKMYDEASYPDLPDKITWIDVYNPSLAEPRIVRATSSELYIGNEKIQDVKGDVMGVTYVGKYYFVDGSDLYVYDNETCYRVIQEPIAHLEEDAEKDATILVLDEIPEILKVGDPVMILAASLGTESNYESTVKSIDTEAKTVTLNEALSATNTVIKTTPIFFYIPKGDKSFIGEEVFDKEKKLAYYLPCELEIADEFAGESYFPDSPSVITVHNSRLFIAGDSEQPHGVYMSRTSQPLYFPSNAGITVKPDGNAIIDLVVFDNALIIGRHNDMYVLYGNSEYQLNAEEPYYIKQMDVSCGFMSSRCGALLNNYYIYLGYDGRFYKLNTPTTYVEYLMTSPLPHKCDIYSTPFTIPQNSTVDVFAVAYRNEIYFNIGTDLVIVYNYDNMAYTYYKGWNNSVLRSYDNRLLIGRVDGKLATYLDDEDVFNDLGVPIECVFSTKRFDFINPISYKYFKQFMITSYAYDDINSYINVDIEVDFTDIRIPESINSNLSRFDRSNWNLDIFNNRNLYKSRYYYLDIRGRTIKFKFSNSVINEAMRIYDVNFVYSMRDIR